ncbi:MAG: hypothetical protein O7A08_09775 [SAR324 cluster bacterium]|nr:hypothetical protein [SAR324 cluster bacterium]MCZ6533239.1 hypothetical protein [SAR324 cluster bacterium]MCZ6626776.1 hypothetical protein [SAR324 cluster bacterium]MCZ6647145.1 hypothetical protein [SAR324 cluster bacterium]MCZ6842062.1 hypothetical protein [SAR324 cluster bacterium]
MSSGEDGKQMFFNAIRLGVDKLLLFFARAFPFLRGESGKTGQQIKDMLSSTSEMVREKAEFTKKAVKLRMAVVEIEHHLNRLYPQIGKITCDLADEGKKSILQNKAIKNRIEVAAEYRERLQELKAEQAAHHSKHKGGA